LCSDISGNLTTIGFGAEDLMKRIDRQIPTLSRPATNLEVSALENSRFFSNQQEPLKVTR
jgi:hypothetical protein